VVALISDSAMHRYLPTYFSNCPEENLIKLAIVLKISTSSWNTDWYRCTLYNTAFKLWVNKYAVERKIDYNRKIPLLKQIFDK